MPCERIQISYDSYTLIGPLGCQVIADDAVPVRVAPSPDAPEVGADRSALVGVRLGIDPGAQRERDFQPQFEGDTNLLWGIALLPQGSYVQVITGGE